MSDNTRWPDDDPELSEAERDVIRGFMDGYDLDNPMPGTNRSEAYRFGFANARDDKCGSPRATADVLREEYARVTGTPFKERDHG